MSFVLAAPEALFTAAANLTDVGSALNKATTAATGQTNSVLAAAADEVSTQIASVFSEHGQEFAQLNAQASSFRDRFIQALTASAQTYAAAEAKATQTLSGASAALAGAVSNAAKPIGETLSSGPLAGLLGGAGTPARPQTGGSGVVNAMSSALSTATGVNPATSVIDNYGNTYYYGVPYYGYGYSYGLVDIISGFFNTLIYYPLYLPSYVINTLLYLPFWLLNTILY